MVDPRGNATHWSYTWPTALGYYPPYGYRLTSTTDALGRTTTYEALQPGSQLITKVTDFRGRVTTLGWDYDRGNLTAVTKPTVAGGTVTSGAMSVVAVAAHRVAHLAPVRGGGRHGRQRGGQEGSGQGQKGNSPSHRVVALVRSAACQVSRQQVAILRTWLTLNTKIGDLPNRFPLF